MILLVLPLIPRNLNLQPVEFLVNNGQVWPSVARGDCISRLSGMYDSMSTLESDSYLGLSTVVQRLLNSYPGPGLTLSYNIPGGNTDGGDQYTGLDRFGRVVEQRWVNTGTGATTDDFLYTYDRDGNRLTRSNGVNSNFSEQYGYDNLNQLTSFTVPVYRHLKLRLLPAQRSTACLIREDVEVQLSRSKEV
jgi:hypothetical protein